MSNGWLLRAGERPDVSVLRADARAVPGGEGVKLGVWLHCSEAFFFDLRLANSGKLCSSVPASWLWPASATRAQAADADQNSPVFLEQVLLRRLEPLGGVLATLQQVLAVVDDDDDAGNLRQDGLLWSSVPVSPLGQSLGCL